MICKNYFFRLIKSDCLAVCGEIIHNGVSKGELCACSLLVAVRANLVHAGDLIRKIKIPRHQLAARIFILVGLMLGQMFYLSAANAQTFPLPARGDVVGQVKTAVAKSGDTIAQIAREYDMGYMELVEANPNVDPDKVPAGTVIVIPSQFILPAGPREGIVMNLAEMRLYYYPKNRHEVVTHPIGIGREGDDTPLGKLKITQHMANPTWHVPESIKKSMAAQGIDLPKAVPPGPDNPLGKYAMRLSSPTYLVHGTNDPLGGIGRRSSSGCLRLYPEDIETLYRQVSNGTNVYIVNEPYKVGWLHERLYIESHVPLEQRLDSGKENAQIRQVVQLSLRERSANVDWNKAFEILSETQGLPQEIGEAMF